MQHISTLLPWSGAYVPHFLQLLYFRVFGIDFCVLSFNLNFKITEGLPASDLNNLTAVCAVSSVFFSCRSWHDLGNTLFTNVFFWKVNCTVLKTSVLHVRHDDNNNLIT